MMKQLALDIGLATGPTLSRFYAGPNEAALQHLRLAAGEGSSEATRSPVPTYLWGEPGSGKTHLLQAVRQALREQGSSVGWLDPAVADPPDFDENWAAVLMDDVHLYSTAQQATAWPASPCSAGASAAQRSNTCGHRVRKAQPLGRLMGLGNSPLRMMRSRRRLGSTVGVAESNAWV